MNNDFENGSYLLNALRYTTVAVSVILILKALWYPTVEEIFNSNTNHVLVMKKIATECS